MNIGPSREKAGDVYTQYRKEKDRCVNQRTTGLDPEQTREVVARMSYLRERNPGHAGSGGQSCWGFYRQVEMVLVILRHDLTQMTIGDLFGVSQPTVSRIWRGLLQLIEEVTCLQSA